MEGVREESNREREEERNREREEERKNRRSAVSPQNNTEGERITCLLVYVKNLHVHGIKRHKRLPLIFYKCILPH